MTVDHPCGKKSHAVRSLGRGIPGVSGELKASGPPTSARRAKLPGVVPCASVEGLNAPCTGRRSLSREMVAMGTPWRREAV
jgi:hypothetical protein